MKILTFTSLFPNQCDPDFGIFIKNRMLAVSRIPGVEVIVVAPVPWFPPFPIFKKWYPFSKIPKHEFIDGLEVYHPRYLVTPKIGMSLYGLSMFLFTWINIKGLHRKHAFNLIDAHFVYPDGFAAILLGRVFQLPVLVSARGTDINLYPKFPIIKKMLRFTLSRADHSVAVSRSLGELIAKVKGDWSYVSVVPNGVDSSRFFYIGRERARQKLGLVGTKKILVTIGGLIERKGIHLLLEAINLLKEQGRADFDTFIIGKGDMHAMLEDKINSFNLGAQVQLLGHIDNEKLIEWYNAADLFFLGSSREGWPNVVCESLACGTPVVATPVNGIPEILYSEELGLMVDRTPEAFAKGIQQALQRKWDRELIAAEGQKRTWQNVAAEVHELFSKVIADAKD